MLPSAFLSRMHTLLGPDFPAFLHAMTEEPPCRGCRVNPVKADPDAFRSRPPFPVRPIPYTPDGFYHSVEKLGHHPFHHAGILYSQDPGAMSTLCALSLPRGIRALDLCAAPRLHRLLPPSERTVVWSPTTVFHPARASWSAIPSDSASPIPL